MGFICRYCGGPLGKVYYEGRFLPHCRLCGRLYEVCRICSDCTDHMGDAYCGNCIEVKLRIDEFLDSDKGVYFIIDKLESKGFKVVKTYY